VERILDAARTVLENEGPLVLTMTRLARDVGVSIGTVYEYFPDRAAVVSALIDRAASDEARTMLERLGRGSGTVQATFRDAVASLFELYRRHHALVKALRVLAAEAWDIGGRPTERLIQDALEEQFRRAFAGRADTDPRKVAFVVFHVVEALTTRMLDHRDPGWTDDECIDEITRVVLGYLGIPSGTA
jgi:AcrR family transcriptional regulator